MDVTKSLNEMISYIEDHLLDDIDYKNLARIIGVSEYTIGRIFPILFGITLNEYIRKRKLTLAGKDIASGKAKIMDVAMNYGYDSATSFSRAFFRFHGIKPSQVKGNASKLKCYPKLKFEMPKMDVELEYEVVELESFTLYGFGIKTDDENIKKDAPNLFVETHKKYPSLPHPDYGMVVYQQRFVSNDYEYWVLWKEKYFDFQKVNIPASKWLKFHIPTIKSKDIQEMSDLFYYHFLENCFYDLRDIPELEYYHDGVTEFLVPIN